jgi:hypothetical protein
MKGFKKVDCSQSELNKDPVFADFLSFFESHAALGMQRIKGKLIFRYFALDLQITTTRKDHQKSENREE